MKVSKLDRMHIWSQENGYLKGINAYGVVGMKLDDFSIQEEKDGEVVVTFPSKNGKGVWTFETVQTKEGYFIVDLDTSSKTIEKTNKATSIENTDSLKTKSPRKSEPIEITDELKENLRDRYEDYVKGYNESVAKKDIKQFEEAWKKWYAKENIEIDMEDYFKFIIGQEGTQIGEISNFEVTTPDNEVKQKLITMKYDKGFEEKYGLSLDDVLLVRVTQNEKRIPEGKMMYFLIQVDGEWKAVLPFAEFMFY